MIFLNPEIVFRKEFDNSGLLFNPANGESFTLNPTAAFIYQKLQGNQELPEILQDLSKIAGNASDSVAEDLEQFLAVLEEKGFFSR